MDRLGLGVDLPVLAAPMAGGASTPALVTAAARAGGLGFLAAGYKTPQQLAEQIEAVRSDDVGFGVNLFVPNPVPISDQEFRRYAQALEPEAARFGLSTHDAKPHTDDDGWADKLDVLLSSHVPLVSFTFGLPDRHIVAALRRAGKLVVVTVTSTDEARAAAETGADGVIVQASAAGGHSATFTPDRPGRAVPLTALIASVRHATALPVIAAGGLATGDDVADAVAAGAEAVMIGTVLLDTRESGATEAHRRALTDPGFTSTVVTRAFTGRGARALSNRFTRRYDPIAPLGYPAVHHLTGPLRRAAAAAVDAELLHLWAGTGYRHARCESAVDTLERLGEKL